MATEQQENRLEVDEELLDDLRHLIEDRNELALRALLVDLHEVDVAQLLESLPEAERHFILGLLSDDVVAEVMLHLPEQQRTEFLSELEPEQISTIVEELSTDDAADIVAELPPDVAEDVLGRLELADVEATGEIRELLRYGEETAGGRMTTDYVAVERTANVADSIEAIRDFARETGLDVHSLYVLDAEERLVGIVRLQDLVLRPSTAVVGDFMRTDIITVDPNEDQEVVGQVMQRYDLIAVPVVDTGDHLLGVITFDDIADIISDESSEDMLYLAGVTEEETPMTSPFRAIRQRLPWLVVNLGTAFIASMVISRFQGAIERVTALAVVMPVVASMGGNAGVQAITVMVRALALGELSSSTRRRAVFKELSVGLLNGVATGTLAGAMVWLMFGNLHLGMLVTVAMIANLLMAGIAGSIIPLTLHRLKFDPALSSGPLVTTFTDVTGFLTFLGLATLTMAWLLG